MTHHQADGSHTLLEDLWAFTKTDALLTALELGVFTQLLNQTNVSVTALANTLAVESTALEKLLMFLGNMGYVALQHATGIVTLTPHAHHTFKNAASLQAWQAYATYLRQVQAAWQTLPTTVQHGVPTGAAFGLTEAEARFSNLNEGLRVLHAPLATELCTALQPYLSAITHNNTNYPLRWLDVGAGSGVWSLPWFTQFPQGEATMVDLPAVLAQAEQSAALQSFKHRIHFLSADCESSHPFSGTHLTTTQYPVILVANLLRELSQEARVQLLKNLTALLAVNGIIVIVDIVLEPERTTSSSEPLLVTASPVQLLTTSITSSGILTSETLTALLTASGIHNEKRTFLISTINLSSLQTLGLSAAVIQKQSI